MFSTSFSFFPVNCKVYFGIPSFKSPRKRRGGVGHATNFHTGRLGPYLQAPTDTIFTQKWYPFHIPCLELCTPFTCCKCTVISIGIHDKNRTFSQLYKTMKFIGSTYDSHVTFHIPEGWKSYPFGAERPHVIHCSKYHPRARTVTNFSFYIFNTLSTK